MSAVAVTMSPAVRLAGKRPPSTEGRTCSTTTRCGDGCTRSAATCSDGASCLPGILFTVGGDWPPPTLRLADDHRFDVFDRRLGCRQTSCRGMDGRIAAPFPEWRRQAEYHQRAPLQRERCRSLEHLLRRVRVERVDERLPLRRGVDGWHGEGYDIAVGVEQDEQRVAGDGSAALVKFVDRGAREQHADA